MSELQLTDTCADCGKGRAYADKFALCPDCGKKGVYYVPRANGEDNMYCKYCDFYYFIALAAQVDRANERRFYEKNGLCLCVCSQQSNGV